MLLEIGRNGFGRSWKVGEEALDSAGKQNRFWNTNGNWEKMFRNSWKLKEETWNVLISGQKGFGRAGKWKKSFQTQQKVVEEALEGYKKMVDETLDLPGKFQKCWNCTGKWVVRRF